MTRAEKLGTYLAAFAAVYLALLFNFIQLPRTPYTQVFQLHILPLLPLYALITFGCYSLAVIGYSLITFRECPEATKELELDIHNARQRLIKRGFRFDD